jgi:hypothetical protein
MHKYIGCFIKNQLRIFSARRDKTASTYFENRPVYKISHFRKLYLYYVLLLNRRNTYF